MTNELVELSKENDNEITLLKNLVITIHTLLCKRDHVSNCQFYTEEKNTFEDTWSQEYHKDWFQITKTLIRINRVDIKTMNNIFENLLKIIKDLNNILIDNPKMLNIVEEVLNDIIKDHRIQN